MRRHVLAILTILASTGCYASHEAAEPGDPRGCDPSERLECVRRSSPCEALELVAAECVDAEWMCPLDAAPYAPPWRDDRCLPLAGRTGAAFASAVHEAPVPVPIGERCAWMLPLERDSGVAHVAIDVADSCDALVAPAVTDSSVEVRAGAEWVGLSASFLDAAGDVRVLARGWTWDPAGGFGVGSVGVGFGRVLGERVVIDGEWMFGADLDLGDAAVTSGDFAYAFGCPGEPTWLEEDCLVARAPLASVDDPSAWSVLGEGGWGIGAPRRVFGGGPHRSAVVRDPAGEGFLHVYAIGFGTQLEISRASAPEGPWSPASVLAACDLPPDDPDAFCAGPVVHLEIFDPMRPSEIVVGYSVATTAADGAERRARSPEAYWPRIVRVPLR